MSPPLAIIQARLGSARLAKKMLQEVDGKSLLRWAVERAQAKFGAADVVVACPQSDWLTFRKALAAGVSVFGWGGPEWDVLGRLHACAHVYRNDPFDQIVRLTPDDWPLDYDRDTWALGRLDAAHATVRDPYLREHVTYALNPDARREINTLEDLEALRRYVQSH